MLALPPSQVISGWTLVEPGTYALIGAASMLGGVTRMTISLTVILVETTNDIEYMLPLMMVVMISKTVGDMFNISLYDLHVELKCIPFVESVAPRHHTLLKVRLLPAPLPPPPPPRPLCFVRCRPACAPGVGWARQAKDVMISPVVTLQEKESVQSLIETLNSNKHNGFPVIRESEHGQPASFIGLVLRSQLVVILRRRAFLADPSRLLNLRDFSTTVSSRSETVPADFTAQELAAEINLVPFMNPAPFSVQEQCPTSRVYRLYGRRQAPPLARRPPSLARPLRGQVPGDGAAASASDKRQLVVPMRARFERCVSACLQGGGGRRERRARNRHPQGPPLRLLARPVLTLRRKIQSVLRVTERTVLPGAAGLQQSPTAHCSAADPSACPRVGAAFHPASERFARAGAPRRFAQPQPHGQRHAAASVAGRAARPPAGAETERPCSRAARRARLVAGCPKPPTRRANGALCAAPCRTQ